MKRIVIIVFVVVVAGIGGYFLINGGFNKMLGGKDISEGVIEYDITYPKLDPKSMMVSGMPNQAFLRFKNNNMSNDMSGMMGLISITFISNHSTKSVEQRLTLINKKYSSTINKEDLSRLNDSYVSSFEKGSTVQQIAGFQCKEAKVKLLDGEEIKVFYTNDIGIENPNWSNPYNKIDGVLMDFQMERYGVVMHLRAKSVVAQKIEDEAFHLPADSSEYKRIDFIELEKILEELNPGSN